MVPLRFWVILLSFVFTWVIMHEIWLSMKQVVGIVEEIKEEMGKR